VGLKLSADGLLSGIPAETGGFNFTVRANGAIAFVSLTIDSGTFPIYGGRSGPFVAEVRQPYQDWVSGRRDLTVSVLSGSLPPGLSLAPDGEISGTPTTAGVYTFTVRFEDQRGDFGISVITIRVGVVQGETRALPPATIGKPYTAQLRGSTLAPGETLPPGLTLSPDGKLSGTPTAPWLYRFSVVLNDAPGDFVTSTYTLEVLN
jgi:hypothetical protein